MGKYDGLRKADGTELPAGEPYWVFRARDVLALPAIQAYRTAAADANLPHEFIAEIDAHMDRIRRWQGTYGAKFPD